MILQYFMCIINTVQIYMHILIGLAFENHLGTTNQKSSFLKCFIMIWAKFGSICASSFPNCFIVIYVWTLEYVSLNAMSLPQRPYYYFTLLGHLSSLVYQNILTVFFVNCNITERYHMHYWWDLFDNIVYFSIYYNDYITWC